MFRRIASPVIALGVEFVFEYFLLFSYPVALSHEKKEIGEVHTSPHMKTLHFYQENAFLIGFMVYQVGVFLGRGSIGVIVISPVWAIVMLQVCNFVIWLFNFKYGFIHTFWQADTYFFFVGLIGGFVIANVRERFCDSVGLLQGVKARHPKEQGKGARRELHGVLLKPRHAAIDDLVLIIGRVILQKRSIGSAASPPKLKKKTGNHLAKWNLINPINIALRC